MNQDFNPFPSATISLMMACFPEVTKCYGRSINRSYKKHWQNGKNRQVAESKQYKPTLEELPQTVQGSNVQQPQGEGQCLGAVLQVQVAKHHKEDKLHQGKDQLLRDLIGDQLPQPSRDNQDKHLVHAQHHQSEDQPPLRSPESLVYSRPCLIDSYESGFNLS